MKKLAIHQTYFFPYVGYFTVLNSSDIFVHADRLQYVKESWMNRNRIIGEDGREKYIIVPLRKAKRDTPINEMSICYDQEWERAITNQFGYYRKRAPYYRDVMDMLDEVFSRKYDNFSELAIASTDIVLKKLGISKTIYRMSELELNPPENIEADEWGILACKHFASEGVDTYVNAPAGKSFYDASKYERNGLNIEFLQNNLRPYDQKREDFISSLSILDVLMFNTPEEVKEMINDFRVL